MTKGIPVLDSARDPGNAGEDAVPPARVGKSVGTDQVSDGETGRKEEGGGRSGR